MYFRLTPEQFAAFLLGNKDLDEVIYDRFKEDLYTFCYKILRNKPEAEDAAADAFYTDDYEIPEITLK